MENQIQSFATFSETRKAAMETKLGEEASAKRTTEAQRFADLLAEYEVSTVAEIAEEQRTEFFAKLVGETDEVETEGNAFGDAVRKAKEAGEDEFTVGGETYKVKESVEEAKVDEAKFNIAAEPERFGDMVKGIIEKQPKRKYLVINGFNSDDNELYGTISDKPIKESAEVTEKVNIPDLKYQIPLSIENIGISPKAFKGLKKAGKNIKVILSSYFGVAQMQAVLDDVNANLGTKLKMLEGGPRDGSNAEYTIHESVTEKKSLNEALQVGNKRAAKKVVTQLNRIFTKQLPDLQQMGKEGIYGCVKYFLDYSMTDANFHTEKPAVVKTIKKANIPGIEVKLPGLGGYHAKISGGRIKEILHPYGSQISNAAGWSGQGIVEGCALYLSQFHKDDATANAMINAFNSQFEGEAIRVDVSKKTKALNESFDIFEAEVKDDESFTEYVKSVYSEAFGEDYDEEKAVKAAQGMLKKADGDYGAAVGMCKASLG